MKALSENLYFGNLDNDAGVFHYLLDAAEEEEVKEAVLAYHFLRTAARPLTAEALDRRIADWFTRRWETAFDFEGDDGVGKLRRLRLVDDDGQGRLTAVTVDEATRRLDQIWDNLFAYHAPPRPDEAVSLISQVELCRRPSPSCLEPAPDGGEWLWGTE